MIPIIALVFFLFSNAVATKLSSCQKDCILDTSCYCDCDWNTNCDYICNGDPDIGPDICTFPINFWNNTTECIPENFYEIDIRIRNYCFTTIPANAFEFVTNVGISLTIENNVNLETIDAQAFANVKASFLSLTISSAKLKEFPVDAVMNMKFQSPEEFYASLIYTKTRTEQIPELRKLIEHIVGEQLQIKVIDFSNNLLRAIPSGALLNISTPTVH